MGSIIVNQVEFNYHRILERITEAATDAGRNPDEIRLVVVTKGQQFEKIRAVLEAGAFELGENYLEEAVGKIEQFKSYGNLIWHMIGHIQSRKAEGVSQHFGYIQSLDSLKLAQRMSRYIIDLKSDLPVLLEFNVSGEETKFGFPAWQEERWEDLLPELRAIVTQPGLAVHGLMGMAPYSQNPESARPYFQRLNNLRKYLNETISEGDWSELSMGMSTDFEIAIQEGATIVRIGEAIMGKRT
jgi:pyridoxal phosphate enzyme (YggS family)